MSLHTEKVLAELNQTFQIVWEKHLPRLSRSVLQALINSNGTCTARMISDLSEIDVNKASVILGRLVKLGYVEEEKVNRRLKKYRLSENHKWFFLWAKRNEK